MISRRSLLRPRAWLKWLLCRGRIPFVVVIEYCRDCGRRQPLIWTAPDDVWSRYATGQHPLCPECFDARATEGGVLLRWVPTVDCYLGRP